MADVSKIKLPSGTTYTIKDNNALPLTGGSVTGPVSFGDSVSIDEATVGDLVVNGSASFTNNLQANTINGVEVGSSPKFTDTNTVTTATTTGSGNAVTAVTASNGALTITKGTTFLTSHQDISGKADKATTLAGYGITDAKIASGTITLGSNTITPLTSSSTLSAAKLSGAIPSAVTATTQASTDNSTKIATTAYVTTAIANLPEPMVFKGSVGTGGTVTSLPTAAASNEGWTYKVITALSSPAAKVGDTVISNGSSWVVIPSGDEPSGTVTSVAVSNGGGLSVSGSPITSSGTITISHADTSSQASSSNSGRTYIQSLTLDTYGHVTGISTATETVTDTNTHRPIQMNGTEILGNNTTALNLKAGSNVSLSNSSGTVTINATDTTYESKAAASGGTAVSLVTTGEKYTWNNKIGATTPTIATDTGTSTITLASAGKYKLTAGGGSVIFTMPTIPTVSYPVTSVNSKTGAVSLTASDVGALASNTTYVSKITTTAGAHTAISNKSGAVSFNVPTKTSHLTNDSGFLTSHQTLYEANLNWGGKDFSASYGPIDAAMIDVLGANRFAFLRAAGLTIEYSTDGGSSYTDYGATDAQKVGLFSSGQSFYLGKHTSNGSCTTNDRLRVTIDTGAANIYTVLNKIAIYMSTSGATVQVLIEKALQSTPTTFSTHKDWTGIDGWSGWNILNISSLTTYGNTAASQYGRIRFTFRQTAVNTTYASANISKIMGFGGVGWATPSTMAATGHLYSYDSSQNATFPAKVTATSFNGPLTGNVTGNVSGTATNVTGIVAIANGGTGQTTAANAINALLNGLPTWTADPTDTTYFVRQDTGGSATYGKVKASTIWNYISGKLPTIPSATGSATTGISIAAHGTGTVIGVQSTTTTASKVTVGSSSTDYGVKSAGSASTWTFEEKTIPNVTSAGTASSWTFEEKTIPNVTAAGSGSASLTFTMDTTDTKKLKITFSHTHTAPTIGTAIKVQSKSGGSNGTAPTLGTAIKVQSKSGGANSTAPTLGSKVPTVSASDVTVPIKNTSASTFVTGTTHTVTDNGHTHTI